MSLELVIQQPWYWVLLTLSVTASCFLLRLKVLDFRFIGLVYLCQYFVHTTIATGPSTITKFATLFWLCFLLGACLVPFLGKRLAARRADRGDPTAARRSMDTISLGHIWVLLSRLFLTLYWSVHLIELPPHFGAVDIAQRLSERHADVLISFSGALVLPALTACMWVWLQRGYRLRWFDLIPLGLSLIGMLGSDSKVSVLPLLLAFAGVAVMRRKPLRELRPHLVLAGIGALVLGIRLVLYYPGGNPVVAINAIAYRLAANTDSVDYLIRSGLQPSDYPFAGLPALIPFISKRLGWPYPYGPGVWLYGVTTGNYAGYGPNPGILMDWFANVGWFGLLAALTLGAAGTRLSRGKTAVAASLLAVLWQGFVDIQILELALIPQLLVIGLLLLLSVTPGVRRGLARSEAALARMDAPRERGQHPRLEAIDRWARARLGALLLRTARALRARRQREVPATVIREGPWHPPGVPADANQPDGGRVARAELVDNKSGGVAHDSLSRLESLFLDADGAEGDDDYAVAVRRVASR